MALFEHLRRQPETGVALAITLLCAPMIFAGYGADTDTYLVLSAGTDFITTGQYRPSRPPGYVVFELVTHVLSELGGSVLTNAVTLGMTCAFLLALGRVCRQLNVARAAFVVACAGLSPYFVASSAVTMEYLWALALLMWGLAFAIAGHRWRAALLFGLAIALRLQSLLFVVCAYGFVAREPDTRSRWLAPAASSALLGALAYLPPFAAAGYSLDFARAMVGGPELWSLTARLGRFVYKNVYFWGLQGTLALALVVALGLKSRAFSALSRAVFWLCVAGIVSTEALYLVYPLEPTYLLFMLPFAAILLSVCVRQTWQVAVVLGAFFSAQWLSINIAKPDVPAQAQSASFGLWLEPGVVWRDVAERVQYVGCHDWQCWSACHQKLMR